MTNDTYGRRKKRYSLYLKLLVNIGIGVAVAALTYFVLRFVSWHCIDKYYATDERRAVRREEYIEDLQSFADQEELTSEDTDKIAVWARENPYLYILIYRNDELFFSSDMSEEVVAGSNSGSGSNSGNGGDKENGAQTGSDGGKENQKHLLTGYGNLISIGIGDNVDRAELVKQAEENGMYPIKLKDGPIFAAVAEYSEELYYNVTNFLSLVIGILMLSVVLIFYFRRIVKRIKRLESDVNIVSHINMNHNILCEGEDEISSLSKNVEHMRNSILENLEKEREVRDANTELITAMSHDIRTPLTVLLGYIDMLKNYEGSDETVKNYVLATERTAHRLKELSDDMFKYSLAFTDSEFETELSEYDAKVLFDQLLSEHVLLLSENGYTVNLDKNLPVLDDDDTVYTDPQNLMRVIDNVFQNIYKYADKNSPVDISVMKDKDEVMFFFRNVIADNPIEAESNGIGLKTCKRLSRFIASDFDYKNDGKFFTVKLGLKLGSSGRQKAKNDKSDA